MLWGRKRKEISKYFLSKKKQKIFQQWENLKANWMMIKSVKIKIWVKNQLDKNQTK